MPDCFVRLPTTVLQPASTTPDYEVVRLAERGVEHAGEGGAVKMSFLLFLRTLRHPAKLRAAIDIFF